jgi:hypothetical protein
MTAKTLDETKRLLLEHEYEYVKLIDKISGNVLFEDGFYGDPEAGLIDRENQWAVVGGVHITVWRNGESRRIDEIKDVDSIKLKERDTIEILTDPWSDDSAIWEVDMMTFEFKKIRLFSDYQGKPFTENVIW